MYDWLAINVGNLSPALQAGDFAELAALGVTRVRTSYADYQNATYVADTRATSLLAKAAGLRVIHGISSNTYNNGDYMLTPSNWDAFAAGVVAEATWAQANGIDEFSCGNEETLHTYKQLSAGQITRSGDTATVTCTTHHNLQTDDSVIVYGAAQTDYNGTFTVTRTDDHIFTYPVANTPATPATGTIYIRSMTEADTLTLVKALVAPVRAVFGGSVCHTAGSGRIYDWATDMGDFDRLGFNIYGQDANGEDDRQNFEYAVTKALRNFGSKCFLSEFNISWQASHYTDEAAYAAELASRMEWLNACGLQEAYFFSYVRGDYAVRDAGNAKRLAWWSLFGQRRGEITRSAAGVRVAAGARGGV